MANPELFSSQTDFNLLSLRDLLAARDNFHLHLLHKANVIGTAVGRYRIRKSDPWPTEHQPKGGDTLRNGKRTPRTLGNSEVRPYSWPAIMVFVAKWEDTSDIAQPDDVIPPAVFMPDGQKVPICVVQAERDDTPHEGDAHYSYPASIMGGGFPVVCDVQGKEHVASIACLVTNGNKVFALTNRHVAGEPGAVISSIIGRNKVPIGNSAPAQLTRIAFEQLYPGWPARNVYVDLDVGLIDIDDVNHWTTQVYGIGEIGPMLELDVSNISLKLIGYPLRAHGAASGHMNGELCALFYRFRSVGGFEYVADALIGPAADKPMMTHPGDSGTLWLTDQKDDKLGPRPLAMQWGGQVFSDGADKSASYALATFLTTVCNLLDVTLLRNWNAGLPNYWGAVGHYGIATKACGAIRNTKLKRLMNANLSRISFDAADINKKNMQGLSTREFVPLADVPDMVWKVGPYKRGGMSSPEHANHFADMDRKLNPPLPEGSTLLEICKGHPENVAVEVWQRYYDAVQKQFPAERESRGLLPFRVWQIYEAMVEFVRQGNVNGFVCAAGIVSHYVGDSCQPLHISYIFNGDPDRMVDGLVRDKKTKEKVQGKIPYGSGVHSAYEDDMVDRHVPQIIAGIDAILSRPQKPALVTGGPEAAVAVVNLMQSTFDTIAPKDIIKTYVAEPDAKPVARADALWDAFGEDTVKVMADGSITLAQLWDSAWKEGGGDDTIASVIEIPEKTLSDIYRDPDFLPSHTLDTIGPLLTSGAGQGAQKRKTASRNSNHRSKKS